LSWRERISKGLRANDPISPVCERYTDSFNRWWDDLGVLHLNEEIAKQLVTGVNAEAGQATHTQLSQQRDAMIAAMQKASADLRRN